MWLVRHTGNWRVSDAGFSLLELLVVLTIISVITGIALPSYVRTAQAKTLRAAADQLYADLRDSQSAAIVNHSSVAIRLIDVNHYEVWQEDSLRKTTRLPDGIRFAEKKTGLTNGSIRFNERGHPTAGGTLLLESPGGQQIKLVIHLHSGQIQIRDEKRNPVQRTESSQVRGDEPSR